MVELQEARQAIARTGIGMQYVLKEARVFDIWSRICPIMLSEGVLSKASIICKGGTSLNKVYFGDMQRFSEDVDLDVFFKKDGLIRDEKIEFIRNNLIVPLSSSYTIPEWTGKRDVIRFICKFKNEIDVYDKVFLDFNIGEKMLGGSRVAGASSTILPLTVDRVPVYPLHALIAKKLKAFYQRGEGKDVYDIHVGLKITKEIGAVIKTVKDTLKHSDMEYGDFKAGVQERLQDGQIIKDRRGSTNPYIPKNLRMDWDVAAGDVWDRLKPHL